MSDHQQQLYSLPVKKYSWGEIRSEDNNYVVSATDFNITRWQKAMYATALFNLVYLPVALYFSIQVIIAAGEDMNLLTILTLILLILPGIPGCVISVKGSNLISKKRPHAVTVHQDDTSRQTRDFVASLNTLLTDSSTGTSTMSRDDFHNLISAYAQQQETAKQQLQQAYIHNEIAIADAKNEQQKQWLVDAQEEKLMKGLENADPELKELYVKLQTKKSDVM